ncbi:hypothetical protein P1P75_08665 [Streptomyces sp. ID05-39B]|uniref:hypothetical protein n=1 Tax=Streptomyces sp. ID05-39B TaxID=3028664 RepID=UPI0029A9B563|nr:hypothetical protein [Streptomyces sp. ID05-39B]MDX3526513.1 hypothetical protein [Streptomyces sp. ID05-39B]
MKDFTGVLTEALTGVAVVQGVATSPLLVAALIGSLVLVCVVVRPVAKAMRIKVSPEGVRCVRRTVALAFLSGVAKAAGSLAVVAVLWWAAQHMSWISS